MDLQILAFLCISLLPSIFAQTPICGGHVSGPSGKIETPNYPQNYPIDTTCKWVIEVSADSIIELKFSSFDIDYFEKNCEDSDVVQVFDGANENSRPMHTRLCGQKIPRDFVSTGNLMTIIFKSSEDSTGAKGFSATYKAKSGDQQQCVFNQCGGIIENVGNCSLQSPGYPLGHQENLNCTWTIQAPEGGKILFHFEEIMLNALSSKCSQNNVTLYDGNDKTKIIYEPLCDMDLNNLDGKKPFESTGRTMTIVLRTAQNSTQHTGFFANFVVFDPNAAASATKTSPTVQSLTTTTQLTTTTTQPTTTTTPPFTTTTLYQAIMSQIAKGKLTSKQTSTTSTNNLNVTPKKTMSVIASTTGEEKNVPIASNPAAVSGLVIGSIIGVVVIVFAILLIIAFFHWRRQNHRFNIRLREEDAQSDVNTLISNADSRETIYKGKKYGKIVRIPTSEEFPL